MGRRKIEIQPITHERNRSVTFLKRKNGLFKKAYELGVLCSVEVAVIIFEEKPGHSPKLYQYCSDDIKAIVARHVRFDGEKDTKAPTDFSSAKADDIAEADEDEVEEEDEKPKKRTDTKNKPKVQAKPVVASSSRITDTEDEQHPSPPISRSRNHPSTPGERPSRHVPDDHDHDDYPSSHKRARTNSYPDDFRAEARFMNQQALHPFQAALAAQQFAMPGGGGNAPYNLYGPGMSGANVFDFLRNPANMRAFSGFGGHGQGNGYPRIPPASVSEAFLASLSEVAAQQGGVGSGIGGIGGGVGGFDWPAGYPSGPPHHNEQSPEPSWLDFLTAGVPSSNIPPPSHLHHPHGNGGGGGNHNHHQWSSGASSEGSHRSDSSMSMGRGNTGILGAGPHLGRPPSTDTINLPGAGGGGI